MKINHKPMFDYLVVGAGFAGAVIAERLASQAGKKVLIIDKRNHIGGSSVETMTKAMQHTKTEITTLQDWINKQKEMIQSAKKNTSQETKNFLQEI